eukprot:IDg3332t1
MVEKNSCAGLLRNCLANSDPETLALRYQSVPTTGVEAVKAMHYVAVGSLPARRVGKAPSEVIRPDKSTKDAEELESEAEVEASSASESDEAQLKDESEKLKAILARLQALESIRR